MVIWKPDNGIKTFTDAINRELIALLEAKSPQQIRVL